MRLAYHGCARAGKRYLSCRASLVKARLKNLARPLLPTAEDWRYAAAIHIMATAPCSDEVKLSLQHCPRCGKLLVNRASR